MALDRPFSNASVRRTRISWRGLARARAAGLLELEDGEEDAEQEPAPRAVKRTFETAIAGAAIPDLLDSAPRLTIDTEMLQRTLAFSFAGGDIGDALDSRPLESAELPRSTWDADCFADGLFLEELVGGCLPVEIKGRRVPVDTHFLARALAHPPADPEVAKFRREILHELADSEPTRAALESLYGRLVGLRIRFSGLEEGRYGRTRRRLGILTEIRDLFTAMAAFDGKSTGLSRIRLFGEAIVRTEAFKNLAALLDYESDLARVGLTVQIGSDGRIRKLSVVTVEENDQNRYYESPLERLWSRLLLWLRGFRLGADELVERWIDAVYGGIEPFLGPCFQLIGHAEFHLAALSFRDRCKRDGLAVCFPEMVASGGREITGLFNPLLFAQKIVPVTCTVRSPSFETVTLLTGPNSGGKTRLLQAIGIAQMLAQSGFYVPAASARLKNASSLFVSLGEPHAADQKEGRLGTELLRIRRLFEVSAPGALVIIDELCSGTNPSEGEEMFVLVISLLRDLEPEVFISTHFLQFMARLAESKSDGLSFLQVELDQRHRPTYRFVPGVATTSLATETAARLGVTREELAALIKRNRG